MSNGTCPQLSFHLLRVPPVATLREDPGRGEIGIPAEVWKRDYRLARSGTGHSEGTLELENRCRNKIELLRLIAVSLFTIGTLKKSTYFLHLLIDVVH